MRESKEVNVNRLLVIHDVFNNTLGFNTNNNQPIVLKEGETTFSSRFENKSSLVESLGHLSAILGSTYVEPQGKKVIVHNLDAICSAYTLDEKENVNGLLMAVCDGFGGHEDEKEDKDIATLGHVAARLAVQHMASVMKAGKVNQAELLQIARLVEKDLEPYSSKGQSTTLSCIGIFKTKYGFIVKGFSVGDCMISVWNPHKKQCLTLLPSVNNGTKDGTPAPINAFNSRDVRFIDTALEDGCILIATTDGISDVLSKDKKGIYQIKADLTAPYVESELDAERIIPIFYDLTADSPLARYTEIIMENAVMMTDAQRRTQPDQKVGDDATMCMARISDRAFKETTQLLQKLRNEADQALHNAIEAGRNYKSKSDAKTYDEAIRQFRLADQCYTKLNDKFGSMRCLMGLADLSDIFAKQQPKFSLGAPDYSIQLRKITYLLETISVHKTVNPMELNSLNDQFLNGFTKQLSSLIQSANNMINELSHQDPLSIDFKDIIMRQVGKSALYKKLTDYPDAEARKDIENLNKEISFAQKFLERGPTQRLEAFLHK